MISVQRKWGPRMLRGFRPGARDRNNSASSAVDREKRQGLLPHLILLEEQGKPLFGR